MKENSQDDKQAVTWACGTLIRLQIPFEYVGFNAWDIETTGGWIAVNSVAELCDAVKGLLEKSRAQVAA